jgi:phospholipase/carboxylesterase
MPLDDLAHQLRPADGEPEGALVLMHGRGTGEHDLVPLFDVLDPERQLLCVAPRGPLSLPPGGRHWYVVRQVGSPDPETFRPTFASLAAWLDALGEETGVPLDRTVVGGFSQGAVMSWALGIGPDRARPGGVMALSGFMPQVPGFPLQDDLTGLSAAIAHGSSDEVIPVGFGRAARDRAEASGADVLYLESGVPHTIDPGAIPELAAWLRARTTPAP